MRILHVLPHLSGGGAERQFTYLAQGLAAAGHDVGVAYLTSGPAEPDLIGVKRFQLKAASNYDPRIFMQLMKLLRRFGPDVVQTWILQMDILGGSAARITGVPWILREPSAPARLAQDWKRRFRAMMARGAHAIVANSRDGHRYWRDRQPTVPGYVVANGTPVAEIEASKVASLSDLTVPPGKFILTAGRLVKSKNIENLIAGLVAVGEHFPVRAIICGEGPEKPGLQALVRRMGLEQSVRFVGFQRPNVLWALMKRSSAYVTMSDYEGCPNTVLEAMAAECPLLLSSIPAHHDLVDTRGAVFCDAKDPVSIAQGIRMILGDEISSGVRVAYSRALVEKWSIKNMCLAYEDIYKEVARM